MTDETGRYVFVQLPAGTYTVTAVAPAYLDGGYDRTPLAEGQWFSDAHFQMWPPASLSGTVRDERGEPLVDLPVRLLESVAISGRTQWATGVVAHSDDRGRYRFGGLRPGRYLVHVANVHLTLPNGEASMERMSTRFPTVTGPAFGEPPLLRVVRAPDGTGLVSGVPSTQGRGSMYPAVFHPAARVIHDAKPVNLEFGEARNGIDVTLAPVSSVSVSGIVHGASGTVADLPVRLVLPGNEALGPGGETGLTKTDAQGRFAFAQVPAGYYRVLAGRTVSWYRTRGGGGGVLPPFANPFVNRSRSAAVDGSPTHELRSSSAQGAGVSGQLDVTVGDQPVVGLAITAAPSVSVSGYVLWDGEETPPPNLTVAPVIRLEPADGNVQSGVFSGVSAHSEGPPPNRLAFTIPDVAPGRYVIGIGETFATSGHRLVGASHRGRDIAAGALDVGADGSMTDVVIHLSSQRNSVVGTVRTRDGRPTSDAVVLIFPVRALAQRELGVSGQRFRAATVTAMGAFEAVNLPPGDYLMAAVSRADRDIGSDPVYLSRISGSATKITIGVSGMLTQDLRLLPSQR